MFKEALPSTADSNEYADDDYDGGVLLKRREVWAFH